MNSRLPGCLACVLGAGALLLCWGCAVVYPELGPPLTPVPTGVTLRPGPPDDLIYLRIKKAWIPARTRDGRDWSGGAPDPYAVVLIGGKELFRTPIQPNTHEPTWPDAPKANYRIAKDSKLTVELWDDATFQNRPICSKDADDLRTAVSVGSLTLVCGAGAKITLEVEPARAKYGLGMWYELRSQAAYLTRVLAESPAGRAEIRPGQRILNIQGKEVSALDDAEIRSLINANARTGLQITVLEPNGKTRTAQLREGPVYPVAGEDADLD